MTALWVWWSARRAARRELDDLYAQADAWLGSRLDTADKARTNT